jgi:hypothetical protein
MSRREDRDDDDFSPEKLPTLPAALAKRPSWDDFEHNLKRPSKRKKTVEVTKEQLGKAAKAIGLPALPPSYSQYAVRFGHWGDWELVYRHARFPRFLKIWKSKDLKQMRTIFTDELDARAEEGEPERKLCKALRSLIPLGSDASGTDFCWDPAQHDKDGELGLCFVDQHADWTTSKGVRVDAGTHLLDVLKYYDQHY